MALRLANSETKKIDLGDGDFIEVVNDISKRDFNALVASMPQQVDADKGMTPVQGTQFQQALFSTFVKSWSLNEPVNTESYLSLSRDSADLIDTNLVDHFTSLTPDSPKGKLQKTSRA